MLHHTSSRTAVLALLLLLGARDAYAQAPTTGHWENTVTLYGWATTMSGTAGVDDKTATVDVPFSEILDNLKMGGMLNYVGRGDRFVAGVDFIYMKLGSDVATPNTGVTLAEVKLKEWLAEGDVGYRVTPWMDALIGVRVPIIETEIAPDVNFPNATTRSKTVSWAAPLIGARAILPLSRHLSVIARADLGGFGLGGRNSTWQAAGYLNYKFGKGWSGTLGYRALAADYATGTEGQPGYFLYDITNFGGVAGIAYTF